MLMRRGHTTRQFMVMCENSRSSILFHYDVPGGRWHTVIATADLGIFCRRCLWLHFGDLELGLVRQGRLALDLLDRLNR
jgi:hypothetical protein